MSEQAASKPPVPRRRRLLRIAIQVIGFAAGVASLAWCVHLALKPQNQVQFHKLATAPRHLIAAMLGLSLTTLVINGLLFWVALLPFKRLRVADVVATNGVCSFLAYLPLKAGAIVRILIHNRRDGVPLLTIGAWFSSMAVIMGAVFVPAILGILWLGPITTRWLVIVGLMELAAAIAVVVAARVFAGQRGVDRLSGIAHRLHLPPLRAFLRSGIWAKLHPGFDMLAHPGTVAASMVLRIMDACTQAARFLVSAEILGVDLPLAQAVPISLTFFVIGIISPSGMAGLREGAATGLAGVLLAKAGATEDMQDAFSLVALLVTATEALVFLLGAAVGIAWLRPHKLLKLRETTEPVSEAQSPPGT